MKKKTIILMVSILSLFTLSACGSDNVNVPATDENTSEAVDKAGSENNNGDGYTEQFTIFDPYAETLSDDLLKQINADGFTGTDVEIAQQILDWQKANMYYVGNPSEQIDVSYAGRWNMFMPGIYPVDELVQEHVTADGKIYGICFDFAMVYTNIANSYGLETRVTYFPEYFSEVNDWVDPATTRGLSMEEYDALNKKLIAKNVTLTYDQIDRVAREGYVHARAEVNIDGKWIAYDGVPSITGKFLVDENYLSLPFDYAYNDILLYAPVTLEDGKTLHIEALVELLSYYPLIEYEGITDDAGDLNRAASYIDLCRGLGLVPYYSDPREALTAFLLIPENQVDSALDDLPEIMADYEAGTGKNFYAIADFLVYGDEEELPAEIYVERYNTITGGSLTEDEFIMYLQ